MKADIIQNIYANSLGKTVEFVYDNEKKNMTFTSADEVSKSIYCPKNDEVGVHELGENPIKVKLAVDLLKRVGLATKNDTTIKAYISSDKPLMVESDGFGHKTIWLAQMSV
jgi:hypothetical protein